MMALPAADDDASEEHPQQQEKLLQLAMMEIIEQAATLQEGICSS